MDFWFYFFYSDAEFDESSGDKTSGMDVEEYCKLNPATIGCKGMLTAKINNKSIWFTFSAI